MALWWYNLWHPPMASLELGGGTGTAQVCCRWSSSILGWSYLARYAIPNAPISCTNFWLLCIHVYAVYYYVHILEWLTTHDHTPTWWDNGHFFQGSSFPLCSHDRAITVCQRIDELWVLTTVHYKTETKQLDKLQLGVWRPSTTARPIVTFFKARLLQYHLKTVEVQDVKSGQHLRYQLSQSSDCCHCMSL